MISQGLTSLWVIGKQLSHTYHGEPGGALPSEQSPGHHLKDQGKLFSMSSPQWGFGGTLPGLSELWERCSVFRIISYLQPHPITDSSFHSFIPHT